LTQYELCYLNLFRQNSKFKSGRAAHKRGQEGQKGPWRPKIFRKYSHFVLWEAFF